MEDKKERTIQCEVVSDKMTKSRVAKVERKIRHSVVRKYIKKTTKLMFHDEKNETKVGDVVLVRPTRPLSSRKKFELVKIINS